MTKKNTILFQMEISKETSDALNKIVNQFPTKVSRRFVADFLLKDAIKRNKIISITNKGKNEKIS